MAEAIVVENGAEYRVHPGTDQSGVEQLERLEEKILRAVELLHSARAEKEDLLRENAQMRRRLAEQQERLNRYEKEREGVKARVQKILDQVDTLTQAAVDAD